MRSAIQHRFSQVPKAEIPRSSFDRSHGYKTTFNAGFLVPVYVDEVLPGDTFNLRMTSFGRLATPLHPFMDNMFLDTFFFFVPLRLVWNNFQKFMGEQANPGDSTSYLCPTSTATAVTGYLNGSLQDYMGLPTKVPGYVHNTFHLRAYNLIWNEWFRDQNMQNSVTVDKGDGPDNPAQYILQRRGKRHDYFTSALPFPQKGPAVQLPIGSSAQIYSNGLGIQMRTSADPTMRNLQNNHNVGTLQLTGLGAAQSNVNFGPAGGGVTGLYADLSSATAATINQLRQAFQIQRIYERDARGGTRYRTYSGSFRRYVS